MEERFISMAMNYVSNITSNIANILWYHKDKDIDEVRVCIGRARHWMQQLEERLNEIEGILNQRQDDKDNN